MLALFVKQRLARPVLIKARKILVDTDRKGRVLARFLAGVSRRRGQNKRIASHVGRDILRQPFAPRIDKQVFILFQPEQQRREEPLIGAAGEDDRVFPGGQLEFNRGHIDAVGLPSVEIILDFLHMELAVRFLVERRDFFVEKRQRGRGRVAIVFCLCHFFSAISCGGISRY